MGQLTVQADMLFFKDFILFRGVDTVYFIIKYKQKSGAANLCTNFQNCHESGQIFLCRAGLNSCAMRLLKKWITHMNEKKPKLFLCDQNNQLICLAVMH